MSLKKTLISGHFVSYLVLVSALIWSSAAVLYLVRYWFDLSADSVTKTLSSIFFAAVAVVTIVGLFKTKSRPGLALAIGTGLVTLFVVETVHYSFTYYPGFPTLSPPLKIDRRLVEEAESKQIWLDKRSKVEVIRDLRLRGVNAYPAFLVTNRTIWDSDGGLFKEKPLPLGSISNSTVVHCNESGKWSIYQSDEKGFNNPTGIWDQSSVTAILLGDSFVHGACVDPGEDLGAQIRKTYPRTINLGQRGNGPLLQLAGIREYGEHLKPNFVIWFYTENNDLDNLRGESKSSFLSRYLNRDFSQGLINRTDDIDRFIHDYTEYNYKLAKQSSKPSMLSHVKYIASLRSLRKRIGLEMPAGHRASSEWKLLVGLNLLISGGPSNIDPPADYKLETNPIEFDMTNLWRSQIPGYGKILAEARDTVNQWGGSLLFVFLPEAGRFINPANEVYALKSDLLEVVNALGIPVIDATPIIGADDYRRFFPSRGGHYNAAGYSVVAETIRDYLAEQQADD